jgi:Holliday junction resolvasome RuvABC endonuclease subunit
MNSIGIDLSLTSTGVAKRTLKDSKLIVETHAFKTTSAMKWTDRINSIREGVISVLEPDTTKVYMENYAFGSKFNRECLGELGGVIREALELREIEIIKFAPTKVKMFATGRGAAPPVPVGEAKSTWAKKWMMNNVKTNFGYEFDTDDETDAFVIATLGETVEMVKNNPSIVEMLPSYQQKAISKILEEENKNGKNRVKSGSREQSPKRRRCNR